MRKKIIYIVTGIVLIGMLAFAPERSSSGAPASHTGAPGEATCAASGCHDDNTVNSGAAILTIEAGSGITQYVAGQTYPIKVRVSEANVNRFGFQLVALNQANMNAGTFQITDAAHTQLLKNDHALTDRNYVTYTFNGTDPTSPGVSEWIVNWTAPSSSTGPITFYAGAVSGDDDMTDKGDHVYTNAMILNN